MSNIMNKIKNHPGFMPFGSVNQKTSNKDTQSVEEKRRDKTDEAAEKKVK